jgi:hypothetical protein
VRAVLIELFSLVAVIVMVAGPVLLLKWLWTGTL